MEVKPAKDYLTNGEFFFLHCYKTDLCRIFRMWERHLDSTIGRDAPMWEKETQFDKWLCMPFNRREWDIAETKEDIHHDSAIPKVKRARPGKLLM